MRMDPDRASVDSVLLILEFLIIVVDLNFDRNLLFELFERADSKSSRRTIEPIKFNFPILKIYVKHGNH